MFCNLRGWELGAQGMMGHHLDCKICCNLVNIGRIFNLGNGDDYPPSQLQSRLIRVHRFIKFIPQAYHSAFQNNAIFQYKGIQISPLNFRVAREELGDNNICLGQESGIRPEPRTRTNCG